MDRTSRGTTAPGLVRHGFSSLAKPPFRVMWFLALFIAVASSSLGDSADGAALTATLVFALVTFVLELAVVLAAGSPAPDPSADAWIRGALRRRCFWRFVVAGLVTDLAVGAGVLVLIVGAFVIAGMIGLAPQAAALERKLPFQALARSAELTRPVRSRIAAVYAVLVLVPTLMAVAPYVAGLSLPRAAEIAISAAGTTLSLAAWIALTRAFTELGGAEAPAPADLGPGQTPSPL